MTLFPRSLLWRTVLLLAVLMVAGHFASLEIFRAAEREPRAVQIAQQIASVVNLTRSALITADSAKRLDLLRDLSQQEGIQVYADAPNEPVEALPDRPITRLITLELQRRLGPDTQLLGTSDSTHGVWVSFKIDDLEYWVRLSRERIERAEQLRWIGWGALILLLSVIGAFAIVARINRPLRELTRAATAIGRGDVPPPVVETGPAEVRTLSRAFNQMATDLQRADADRALLLAGVSHDLRTPLARLRLGIELGTRDESTRAGMVADIEEMDRIIGQFLDFARDDVTTTMQAGDLNAVVAACVERYTQAGQPVTFAPGAIPPLPLKATAISRLVANLVDNALAYGAPPVEVATTMSGNEVWLDVADRGAGIPAGQVERLKQPFTRATAARARDDGAAGAGLGLAIVERIARIHGGSFDLKPRDGGGTLARVTLPAPAPKAN